MSESTPTTAPSEQFREGTEHLMRPRQVADVTDEKNRLQGMLGDPSSQMQDKAEARRQLKALDSQLETAPKAYSPDQIDKAIAREAQLKAEMLQGMPTQEEMRRCPPGAVDKHRAWEDRNKPKVLEWKNIRLRRAAGGDIEGVKNPIDVANIEMFRPSGDTMNSRQLSLDNAVVPTRNYYFPADPKDAVGTVIFTEEDLVLLQELSPDVAAKISFLDNDERERVLSILRQVLGKKKAAEKSETAAQAPSPSRKAQAKRGRKTSAWDVLRAEATGLGISIHGKKADDLKREIAERKAAAAA